jgi:hypothetical protein
VPVILYHRGPDGLIHYERAASLASPIPTTQQLLVDGPDPMPDAPAKAATAVEHNAWLQRCRDADCTVKVKALAAEQEADQPRGLHHPATADPGQKLPGLHGGVQQMANSRNTALHDRGNRLLVHSPPTDLSVEQGPRTPTELA